MHVVEADIHLNGQLSLGENIADNGGVKTAFNAYKAWKSNTTGISEPALPGFQNFTSQQMFFLAYANVSSSWKYSTVGYLARARRVLM